MKKGICKNCSRSGMAIIGRDLCPACYRYKDDPEGLKAAAKRLGGQKPRLETITAAAEKNKAPKAKDAPVSSEKKSGAANIAAIAELLVALGAGPGLRTTITITIEK